MKAFTVTPGKKPAQLLLELLEKQGEGFILPSSARYRLLKLGYIRDLGGWTFRLNLSGVEKAKELKGLR